MLYCYCYIIISIYTHIKNKKFIIYNTKAIDICNIYTYIIYIDIVLII
ncbi:hypothetical protein Lyticum_00761 [Lyticum sinuosum]|uniref:Uncharacterized protein n=1 Tax=Lyticum sinuosum TaxID=1332059 RepID=A0AAE4VKC2_9RICK|nr:hypothetical protein [Lyticum sinuosum]